MSKTIARDKTTKTEFPIHLSLAFEWLPFIGVAAFSLYALYRAMAQTGQGMGVRKIGKVMGVGKDTVHRYTALLVHCELIEVQPGSYTLPNHVDIIDPPDLDYQLIEEIVDGLHNDKLFVQRGKDGKLRPTRTLVAIINRAGAWQPVAAAPPLAATYTNGNGAAPIATDTAALVSRLQRVCNEHGSDKGAYFNGAVKFVDNSPPSLLIGWLDAIEANPAMVVKIDGVAGWITNKVSNGEIPPSPPQKKENRPTLSDAEIARLRAVDLDEMWSRS